MPFLPPNQQHQSTEGVNEKKTVNVQVYTEQQYQSCSHSSQAGGSRLLLTETEIISDEYIRNNKKIKITKLKFQQPWLLKYH